MPRGESMRRITPATMLCRKQSESVVGCKGKGNVERKGSKVAGVLGRTVLKCNSRNR